MKTKVSIAKIINTTAKFYQVSSKKLQKKGRKAKFVKPRQIAMYLLREELNRSFPYIGRLFGSKDHTTVIYAYNKIKNAIQESPELRSELEQLKNILYSQTQNKTLNKDMLVNLSPREQKILGMRFGLEDGIIHTLEEVGQELGVTRERIRQIEVKSLKKIRENEINFNKNKPKNMDKQNPIDKKERFKRLAVYRTNEVLKRLRVLGNCANRSAYEYTEEEINKIFSEIERRVKGIKAKFNFPKEKEFKL